MNSPVDILHKRAKTLIERKSFLLSEIRKLQDIVVEMIAEKEAITTEIGDIGVAIQILEKASLPAKAKPKK